MALDDAQYLDHLRRESARFRDVLSACDPHARVPGCPAWTADDLLWHLTGVQDFWTHVVTTRPEPPKSYEEPSRPADQAALVAAFDAASAGLVSALESASGADPAWTWSTEQTVGFVFRRQAHEALIHRLDAEQAARQVTPMDVALAADGVEEVLDVMYGACPPWGEFAPLPHYLRIDLTDADRSVWVQLGHFSGTNPDDGESVHEDDDIHVVADPGVEPDAVIDGPAEAVNTWLWRRADRDPSIRMHGHRLVFDHFRAAVHHPIN